MMFYIGLKRYESSNISTFTSGIEITLRKLMYPMWGHLGIIYIQESDCGCISRAREKKTNIFAVNYFFDGGIEQRSHTIKDKVLRKKFIRE